MTIDDYLDGVQSIAITGHVKPDGDCIGSVLALYNYLDKNYPFLQKDMYLQEPDKTFRFLHGFEQIKDQCDEDHAYDILFILDCSTRERMGEAQKYLESAVRTVNIDHHVSNERYAQENYVCSMSSACEALYGFLKPEQLNREIAECLYTGIVTDTGVFRYESTTPQTMRTVAFLMEYGINTSYIVDESFFSRNFEENRILGYALMKSQLDCDGKLIYVTLSQSEMERFQVTSRDLGSVVSQIRLVRGVLCAVFLYESGPGEIKVSFRSEAPLDVNELAVSFGGGGHVRASGVTIVGELDTCLEGILIEIRKRIAAFDSGSSDV